jgi:hypothetical protein
MDSPASSQPEEADEYQKEVSSRCESNPGLQHLDDFLRSRITSKTNSKVSCLDVLHGTNCAQKPCRISGEELANLLRHPTENCKLLGQILIIEDLDPFVIGILGDDLKIDPLFFAQHLFYARNERTTEKGVPRRLPSAATSMDFFSFRYYRPLVLGNDVQCTFRLLCRANVRRIVGIMQEQRITTDNQCVAFMARMFSTLLCPRENGKWLCK